MVLAGLSVGAVLGSSLGHDDALPIALGGRVWVYCDAAAHSIEPGDLLTTSDSPGHAMKVTDYEKAQGAIRRLQLVGKPLELSGKGLDGRPFDIGSLRGNLIVVHYWATWCEPCKQEMKRLRDLLARGGGGDVLTAPPGNTTLTVVVTNLGLEGRALRQLATQVHASMSQAIEPFHGLRDGDVLYAVTTGEIEEADLGEEWLSITASELAWDAVLSSAPGSNVSAA